jgi:iron uptake system component EfeO
MTMRTLKTGSILAAGAATLLALTACASSGTPTQNSTKLTVDSSATECVVSASEAPSGTVVFTVSNSASESTEFYVLASDGKSIVAEVENVTPGIKRDLVIQMKPGSYFTACKPGMTGDGVGRAVFTVTQ